MDEIYSFYLRWYVTDPKDRRPRTIEDFCSHYEITITDIDKFEQRATFFQDIEREIRNWGISQLPEVVRQALAQAKTGKPAAVRAYKELITESKKEQGNTLNFFAISPSPDQYKRILKREQRAFAEPDDVIDVPILE